MTARHHVTIAELGGRVHLRCTCGLRRTYPDAGGLQLAELLGAMHLEAAGAHGYGAAPEQDPA